MMMVFQMMMVLMMMSMMIMIIMIMLIKIMLANLSFCQDLEDMTFLFSEYQTATTKTKQPPIMFCKFQPLFTQSPCFWIYSVATCHYVRPFNFKGSSKAIRPTLSHLPTVNSFRAFPAPSRAL